MGRKKRKRAFDSEARVFNDFCLTDFDGLACDLYR